MRYYTLHIDDSGAIEDFDEKVIDGQTTLVCKMYDDPEFNSVNDMLHSLNDFILNDKAHALFKKSNIIPYDLMPAIVKRKEKQFGLIKIRKSYNYYQIKVKEPKDLYCYDWINFEESEISLFKGEEKIKKLFSHEELLRLITENYRISSHEKAYSWKTKTIVFNKKFDTSTDLFKIPLYSWGTYVSERFKELLVSNNITDIGFADKKEDLGKVWQPRFPDIRFE